MANLIRVIGIGPGHPDYIIPAALKHIRDADILAGGERALQPFTGLGKETYVIKHNLAEMVRFIKDRYYNSSVVVLASGDPGFYGILEFLKKHFAQEEIAVYPGISSAQLACARLGISWHDADFFSTHGRGMEGLADLVKISDKVIVLTDPASTPAVIAGELNSAGIAGKKVFVCENLSYAGERVGEYSLNDIPAGLGKTGCVLVITGEPY